MKDKSKKLLTNKYFLGSALVTLLYVIYLIIANISPFGKNSILKTDLYQQYAEFLSYYRECLLNGKSILFSWNLGLGNNFFTTFAYYLVSPFNLLIVFFKSENVYIFVMFVTYLKLIMIYNMAMLYLNKCIKIHDKMDIILAICYTFSSFTICYLLHIMWLDALYMLPIILIMVESYIKDNKLQGVIITVALNVIFNYYLGFITAFFAGCYYVARVIIETNFEKNNFKESIKNILKNLIKYLLGMVIAFGIAMILFLPSFMQVKSTMETDKISLIKIDKTKICLFFNTLFNNHNYMYEQEAGIIFSSTIITIMSIFFFLNKKIKLKEKIVYLLGLIFMLLPIISPLLNKIWHGMTTPNCFNYRYGFCLIFFTIIMSARTYKEKEGIEKKHFIINFIVFFVLLGIEILLNVKQKLIFDNFKISYLSIAISCLTYIAMLFTIYLMIYGKRKIIQTIARTLLVILVVFDISVSIRSYQTTNHDNYFTVENVKQYDNIMNEIVKKIECEETDRIIFKPNDAYTINYSMKYGYSSIDYFTSARNKSTIRGMYQLGYNIQRDDALWITSESGTSINYYLAGVKYIVTKDNLDGKNKLFLYDYEETIDGFNVYKLNVKQDFAYYLTENINEKESDNPFYVSEYGALEYQNMILQNMLSKDENYMYVVDQKGDSYNEKNEKYQNISRTVKEEKKATIIDNKYSKEEHENNNITEENDKKSYYRIDYKIKPEFETDIYLYSDNNLQLYKKDKANEAEKNEENEKGVFKDYANLWSRECGIKQVVHLEKDEEYEFYITIPKDVYEKENERYEIYALDNDKIKQALTNLNKQKNIEISDMKIGKNKITLKVTSEKDGYIAMPISFDEGLRATVNDKKQNVQKINQCFSGVKISKGTSNITITFIPRYFKMGLIMSIVSLVCLIIVISVENKNNKIYNSAKD